ncbi:MAG: thioredoxin family protein [Deltaproteobacteria bacterium]|jgi:thioredoxin 1|nr:thioredoxin family protein [Deltaproteobacteria bacterium]
MRILLVLAVLAILMAPEPAPAAVFPTQEQLDRGLRPIPYQDPANLAIQGDKYVILYFWADWCGNCAIFSEMVLSDGRIIEAMNSDFLFVPVDVDKNKEVARSYKVRAVPTLVFLDKRGWPAAVLPGAVPGQVFSLVLEYMSSGAYVDLEFAEFVERGGQPGPRPFGGGAAAEAKPIGLGRFLGTVAQKAGAPQNLQMASDLIHLTIRSFIPCSYWAWLPFLAVDDPERLLGRHF